MKFISSSEVERVLEILNDKNFKNKKNLNAMKFNGTIVPYEVITNYVKSINNEKRITIKNNIDLFFEDNKEEINEHIARIMNYVLLEIPRADEIERFGYSSEQAEENLRELRNKIRDVEIKRKNHEKKIEKMQSDFISILSIFSAVIIAFFGGLNIVSSALANMHTVTKYRLMLTLFIIGFIMFNVIYMLLNEVYKITNRSWIKGIKKCSKCEDKKHIKCLVTKHTIPFYYNLAIVLGILLTGLAYITDEYNLIMYVISLLNKIISDFKIPIVIEREFVPVIGVIIIISIFYCVFEKIRYIITNNICKNKDNDKENDEDTNNSNSIKSAIDNVIG